MTTNHRSSVPSLLRDRRTRWLLALVTLLLVAVPVGLLSMSGPRASNSMATQQDSRADGVASAAAAPDRSSPLGNEGSVPARAPAVAQQGNGASTPDLSPLTPKISRDAWLGMQVSNLAASSAQVRSIGSAAGGSVTSERVVTGPFDTGDEVSDTESSSNPDRGSSRGEPSRASVPQNQARLALSVPATKLDGVLAELARVGTVSYRSSQAQDMTNDYIDAQARVEPARASVARVQALLADATDLKQVVLIESELSKRQADLDSLTARLTRLDRLTSMSAVTVTLWVGEPVDTASDHGFVDGLMSARDGLVTSVSVITVGLATLAPWLLLLALLGWAVVRVQRRRHADIAVVVASPTPDPAASVTAQHTG